MREQNPFGKTEMSVDPENAMIPSVGKAAWATPELIRLDAPGTEGKGRHNSSEYRTIYGSLSGPS